MSIANPFAFLALLSIPALIVIHLYRRKLKERKAAGLFLFIGLMPQSQSGRKRMPLVSSWSFWLEILFALVATWFLLGVSFIPSTPKRQVILVLDDSASMSVMNGGHKVVDSAKTEIETLLKQLRSSDEVTFIITGTPPEKMVSKYPPQLAQKELDKWNPQKPWHSPQAALELGKDLADKNSELFFFTDWLPNSKEVIEKYCRKPHTTTSNPDLSPLFSDYEVHAQGQDIPNIGIVQSRRFFQENEEKLLLRITAFTQTPGMVEVTLSLAEPGQPFQPWKKQSLLLTPLKSETLVLSIPKPNLSIQVDLPKDAFEADNHVLLLPEPEKKVRVWNELPLATNQALRLEKLLTALQTQPALNQEQAQLVFQAVSYPFSPSALSSPKTYVLMGLPSQQATKALDHWKGPYIIEQHDALLKEVKLEGVIWAAGQGAIPGIPLILANEQVLMSEEFDGNSRRLFFNLDPKQSKLASSVDWPILMKNVLSKVQMELPGPKEINVPLGHSIQYRTRGLEEKGTEFFWQEPTGQKTKALGFSEFEYVPKQTGQYQFVQQGAHQKTDTTLATFSVFFTDEQESDLRLGQNGVKSREIKSAASSSLEKELSPWNRLFILMLLIVVFINWIGLSRERS